MNKILSIIFISLSFQLSFSQSHRFSDLGVLFNQKELSGTARYKGLSGAMGALGGDISTINQNPAGLGVFNHNDFSISLGTTANNSTAEYSGSTSKNTNYDFNLNQIGFSFVFKKSNSDWKKTVLGLNYQKTYNFNNSINISGNSGFASFNTHPFPSGEINSFNTGVQQDLENNTSGSSSVFNIGLASQYKENFFIGASLNFHNSNISQNIRLAEKNQNNDNTILDAELTQEDRNIADGISLNIGILYKVSSLLRLGLAYESPTLYYKVINESNIFDDRNDRTFGRATGNDKSTPINESPNSPTEIKGDFDIIPLFDDSDGFRAQTALSIFEYSIRTASKFNISSAFILSKFGLLSLDYSYHNYGSLNLSGEGSFSSENNYFSNVLNNTHNIKGGGEIRFNNLTLRGGLSYEQSPYDKSNTNKIDVLRFGNKYGASLGAGLRIENHKFDISYNYTEQNNSYDFYDDYNQVAPVSINQKNSKVNITYTYIF